MNTRAIVPVLVLLLVGSLKGAVVEQTPAVVPDLLEPLEPGAVKLGGVLGAAIDRCESARLGAQEVEMLVRPFRERRDLHEWRSEFWGKWMTAAVAAWRYSGDAALRPRLARAVAELIATQSESGYIGAYADGNHLQRWDLWGRKYTLLGLLAWHEATGDAAALTAARREADFILEEVGPGRRSPFTNDMWNGMASSSVIEPIVLLYRRTGDARYLAFARFLVASWPQADGPDLLNKALAGMPVFRMFPGPEPVVRDYHDGGHSKAYEMMSCFEGLAELYRSTGDERYLEAVKNIHASIRDTEITLIGSGSDWERWCDGGRRQTETWTKGMETCVTVTWMKLAAQVLRLTADPACADEIECSAYNALLGAQARDGSWWCHHTPLAGVKERAPEQCDLAQNCCVANGPRGLLLLPTLAVMRGTAGPVVNFYAPMEARVGLPDGGIVRLAQTTEYPYGGSVRIAVQPDRPRSFVLALRIPAWSTEARVAVSGHALPDVRPGKYVTISRRWGPEDVVEIELDLHARCVPAPGDKGFAALMRGPLVLARDQRLGGEVDAPVQLPVGNPNRVVLTEAEGAPPEGVARVFLGPNGVRFCDFASAGNTWSATSRYRVWLPSKSSN